MTAAVQVTEGQGTTPSTAREVPTNIDMAKTTWTLLIGYLVKRRSRPQLAESLAWFATAIATLPVLAAKDFAPTLGPLGPTFWFYAFLFVGLGSVFMILRGWVMALASAVVDLDIDWRWPRRIKWHWPRRLDWVPCDVADFVQFVEQRLKVEQQQASETANAQAITELRALLTDLSARLPKTQESTKT